MHRVTITIHVEKEDPKTGQATTASRTVQEYGNLEAAEALGLRDYLAKTNFDALTAYPQHAAKAIASAQAATDAAKK